MHRSYLSRYQRLPLFGPVASSQARKQPRKPRKTRYGNRVRAAFHRTRRLRPGDAFSRNLYACRSGHRGKARGRSRECRALT